VFTWNHSIASGSLVSSKFSSIVVLFRMSQIR